MNTHRMLPSVAGLLIGLASLSTSGNAQQFVNAFGGVNLNVSALAGTASNNLFVGQATFAAGNIRRFNGAAWVPFGTRTQPVSALALAPNGSLIVGRSNILTVINPAGSESDLGSFSALVVGFGGPVLSIAVSPTGNILAGGAAGNPVPVPAPTVNPIPPLRLHAPSGTQVPFINITGVVNQDVVTSVAWINGNTALVGGSFALTGQPGPNLQVGLAQLTWNGGQQAVLTPFATPQVGLGRVEHIEILANGDIVTINQSPGPGGNPNSTINRLLAGTNTWVQLGITTGGAAESIQVVPDGDLVVCGAFATMNGVNAPMLARLSGTTWSGFGTAAVGTVRDLAFLDNGDLAVAGLFGTLGTLTVNNVAALRSTTPALVTEYGRGCIGPGGLNVLTNQSRPYIGTTIALTATGMIPASTVFLVQGLNPTNVQFPAPFQQGCLSLASQDIITPSVVPATGVALIGIPLPDNTALVGTAIHVQALNTNFTPTNFTSTNAFKFLIGNF